MIMHKSLNRSLNAPLKSRTVSLSRSIDIARPFKEVFWVTNRHKQDKLWRKTPAHVRVRRNLVSNGNSTRFTYELKLELTGFRRHLAPIIRSIMTLRADADLRRLKRLLETK